jgi:hypothetical protein
VVIKELIGLDNERAGKHVRSNTRVKKRGMYSPLGDSPHIKVQS